MWYVKVKEELRVRPVVSMVSVFDEVPVVKVIQVYAFDKL
jgi:hypothetical protein